MTEEAAPLRVAILADDLIWSTRLAAAVSSAGGVVAPARNLAALRAVVADGVRLVIVDLTARAYDGIEAVREAHGSGARVLAVGQHDDVPLRRAALEAGADRVLPYRKLFEGGPATIAAWLGARVEQAGR